MDFRHLIVTCLFSKLRLPFDNQKVKENYAIFFKKRTVYCVVRCHKLQKNALWCAMMCEGAERGGSGWGRCYLCIAGQKKGPLRIER